MTTNECSIDKRCHVETWLQSLDTDPYTEEPAPKRLRHDTDYQNDTFTNPYNLPSSSPITMSHASFGKQPLGKLLLLFDITFGLSLTSESRRIKCITSRTQSPAVK